jgi:uncharacterized lipoprotein NlpE involved in copper resistance
MKNLVFILAIVAFAVMGCKNAAEKKAEPTTAVPSVTAVDTTKMPEPAIVGGSTFTCYQFVSKGKDVSSCQIETRATLNPFVSGYYDWAPYEKDGAHGVLKNGVIEKDLLTADYVYMIEGSVQSEEVYFKMEGNKLTKLEGELVEKKGKLVAKDKTKLKAVDVMTKVDCGKLKETIDNIKAIEKELK